MITNLKLDVTLQRTRALHFHVTILLNSAIFFSNEHKVFFFSPFCLRAQQSTTFRAVFLMPRATKDMILSSVLDCDNLKGASKRSSKSISRPLPIAQWIFVHSCQLLLLLAQAIYLLLISLPYTLQLYPYFPLTSNYQVSSSLTSYFSFS